MTEMCKEPFSSLKLVLFGARNFVVNFLGKMVRASGGVDNNRKPGSSCLCQTIVSGCAEHDYDYV